MSRCLAAVLVAVAASGVAFAQDQKQPPRGGGFGRFMGAGASNAQLLEMKEVQADLKVSDADKDKLKTLAESLREGDRKVNEELRDASREERMEKMTARRADVDKQVKEALGDKFARYRQIRLQLDGAFMSLTMTDADARKALDVTDDQVREMREASMAGIEFPQPGGERPSPEKMAELREKMQKNQAEAVDKTLSAEQKKKWDELIGEKVTYKRPAPQGGGRGQGRPRGEKKDAPPPA